MFSLIHMYRILMFSKLVNFHVGNKVLNYSSFSVMSFVLTPIR